MDPRAYPWMQWEIHHWQAENKLGKFDRPKKGEWYLERREIGIRKGWLQPEHNEEVVYRYIMKYLKELEKKESGHCCHMVMPIIAFIPHCL